MIRDHSQEHLSAELIQAFLDDALPAKGRAEAEEHLASCVTCAGEVDTWRHLFAELGDVPALRPHEGFGDRVMMGVRIPEHVPLAARVTSRLRAWLPGTPLQGHVPQDGMQDFVRGLAPAKLAAQIQEHLDDCGTCSKEILAWRTTFQALDGLGHFAASEGFSQRVMDDYRAWQSTLAALDGLERLAPSEGFAARVMQDVQVPRPVAVASPARQVLAAARDALSWAGKLVPNTRQAWAALSGVAVTPMATLGLVLYTLFSHPTLTPGALLSFAGWKVAALASTAWTATQTVLLESAGLFRVYTFMESLVAAPAALAGGFLVFSCLMAAATWVLYKNLIATPSVDGQYARVSI